MTVVAKKFFITNFTLLSVFTFVLIGFGIVATLAIAPLILYAFFGAVLVFSIGLLFFRKPLWALYTFILLLPFHSLLLTILISQFNFPISLVKVIASWKEALLIGVTIAVFTHLMVQQRTLQVIWVDWVTWLWLGLIIFYFLFHDVLFDWESDLTLRLYGARDWLLYLLPYFVGRVVVVSDKNLRRVMKTILWVGVVTSVLGIVEYFFIPTEWHVQLGVPKYFGEFLNLIYPDYLFGLPPNYWTSIADQSIRRAVSTYLSGQGFAIPFLVIIPVVTYYYLVNQTKSRFLLLSICWIALLLTITRMTIVVCFLQSLALLLLLHKTKKLFVVLVVGFLISVAILFSSSSIRSYIFQTVTFQDDSGRARPGQWLNGVKDLLQHPLGSGLGSTGQVGARFNQSGVGTEAGYLKITGALGLPGLLLFLSWFWGILFYAFRAYCRLHDSKQAIAGVTFIMALGFLLNNLTAPPDQSTFVIYVFSWLAGLAVQQATLRLSFRQPIPLIPNATQQQAL